MSKCAAEKQRWLSGFDVHGVCYLTVQKERFAHVIQQHKEDYQSPQGINGQQALVQAFDGGDVSRSCHRMSQAGGGRLCQWRLTVHVYIRYNITCLPAACAFAWGGSASSELEEGGSITMIVCISPSTSARRAKGSRSYLVNVSSQLLQPNERVQLFRAGFAGWRCIAGVAGELPLASH
ncbi:hypothetical protein D9M69_601990 [compost metagenome]